MCFNVFLFFILLFWLYHKIAFYFFIFVVIPIIPSKSCLLDNIDDFSTLAILFLLSLLLGISSISKTSSGFSSPSASSTFLSLYSRWFRGIHSNPWFLYQEISHIMLHLNANRRFPPLTSSFKSYPLST